MKILVTNHWLKKWGGSETFTYTLIEELVCLGHDVDLFTQIPGLVSDKIYEDFKVRTVNWTNGRHIMLYKPDTDYDVVLANHNTTVDLMYYTLYHSNIIQTCHGVIPKLEQPSKKADTFVSISKEVQQHLKDKNIDSTLILNGINCERFRPTKPLNPKPKTILSMVFSEPANILIKEACNMLGIKLITLNKHVNPVFDVENQINNADLVIGLGRCAYEAMACGRPVIVYDARPYMPSYADGYLDQATLKESIKHNCSGRRFKKAFTSTNLAEEILKYSPNDGAWLRQFALKELNIKNQVQRYLKLIHSSG